MNSILVWSSFLQHVTWVYQLGDGGILASFSATRGRSFPASFSSWYVWCTYVYTLRIQMNEMPPGQSIYIHIDMCSYVGTIIRMHLQWPPAYNPSYTSQKFTKHTHIYIYRTYTDVCIYIYVNILMCVHIYIWYTCSHTYIYIHPHSYIYIYTHVQTYSMCKYTYVYIYTCHPQISWCFASPCPGAGLVSLLATSGGFGSAPSGKWCRGHGDLDDLRLINTIWLCKTLLFGIYQLTLGGPYPN